VVKVADFGLSTLMSAGEFLRTQCGSPHYVAPEVLNFDGTTSYDGCEADAWSLGVILHVLLVHKLPFEADNTALLYSKIRQGLPGVPSRVPDLAASLLTAILVVQPSKRLTVAQMAAHAWLDSGGEAEEAAARAGRRGAARDDEVDILGAAARRAARDAGLRQQAGGQDRPWDPMGLALVTTLSASPPDQSDPGAAMAIAPRAGVALQAAASPLMVPTGTVAGWERTGGGEEDEGRVSAVESRDTLPPQLTLATPRRHPEGRPHKRLPTHKHSSPAIVHVKGAAAVVAVPRVTRVVTLSPVVDALVDVDQATLSRVAGGALPRASPAGSLRLDSDMGRIKPASGVAQQRTPLPPGVSVGGVATVAVGPQTSSPPRRASPSAGLPGLDETSPATAGFG